MGTDKLIPEIMYKEVKKPTCPRCKEHLTMDDPGCWYCENSPLCLYSEYNNITVCQGECGGETLVLSRDYNFDRLEDRYCQVEDPEGPNCLAVAHHESAQAEAEYYELERHRERCNNEDCDCRNY